MLRIEKYLISILVVFSLLLAGELKADSLKVVPILDVQFTGWEGDNPGAVNSYRADGAMSAIGVMLQKDMWFGGLLLKSGQFDFDAESPVQHDSTAISSASVERSESDLVIGYYFWERVALFLDFKNSTSDWVDNNYSVASNGAGFGVSGFYPLAHGRLYASFAVANLAAEVDGTKVGTGSGSSTEFGWAAKLSEDVAFKIGFKSQTQVMDYEIAGEQTNRVAGIVVGLSMPLTL